ncbi:MAG: DUF6273 domain-containing protein [Synergistaceae bacterium]|nr:DUF6273 domain-containing protein [Synergistaceae bacterium]
MKLLKIGIVLLVVAGLGFYFVSANNSAKLAEEKRLEEENEKEKISEQARLMSGYDWRVLDVQNDRALLLCANVIEKRPYNKDEKDVTWETCELRGYLNGEFYNKLPGDFKAKIAETKLANDNNQWYGTSGGNATTDKIFLLSIEEVVRYFGDSGQLKKRPTSNILNNDIRDQYSSARIAKEVNGDALRWWLRSPGLRVSGPLTFESAAAVDSAGHVCLDGNAVFYLNGGVRPALWVDVKSLTFAEPTAESLVKSGLLFLGNSDWKLAGEYFGRALDIDPEYAPAYMGKLCAALKVNHEDGLEDHTFAENEDYQKALRFADADYRAKLEGYVKASEEKRMEKEKMLEQISAQIREQHERGDLSEIVVHMGGYDWRVLGVQNDSALLLCVNIIENRPYNKEKKDVTWETCGLRGYLNGEFYDKFSEAEKAKIAETTIQNENNQWYGTSGGNPTNDKIFLLSIEEIVEYFGDSGQLKNRPNSNPPYIGDQYDSERIAKDKADKASGWWLRSPGSNSNGAACVFDKGGIYVGGPTVNSGNCGVRPALWLNL